MKVKKSIIALTTAVAIVLPGTGVAQAEVATTTVAQAQNPASSDSPLGGLTDTLSSIWETVKGWFQSSDDKTGDTSSVQSYPVGELREAYGIKVGDVLDRYDPEIPGLSAEMVSSSLDPEGKIGAFAIYNNGLAIYSESEQGLDDYLVTSIRQNEV